MTSDQPRLRREVEPSPRPRWTLARFTLAVAVASLFVSGAAQLAIDGSRPQPPADAPGTFARADYYVSPGDTVWSIAQRLEVPGGPGTVIAMNQMDAPGLIRAGQVLRVLTPPERAAGLPRPFANPIAPAPICEVAHFTTEVAAPRELERACYETACVAGENGTRLCHCLDDESSLFFEEPGRSETRIPVPHATRANLLAGELDLDGDGADELVAVIHLSSSNGIALMHHHAVIFDGRDRGVRVSFETIGWGVAAQLEPRDPPDERRLDGLFLRRPDPAGGRQCTVAPASFETLEDPVLGRGNYFAQRLLEYRPGELRASGAPDLRVRRLHPEAKLQRWSSD